MKVYELAKELGIESSDITSMLGVTSHLSNLDELQVKQARASLSGGKVDDGIVHFFSWNINQQVAATDGNIRFDKHRLMVKRGSEAERLIRGSKSPYISEVLNKPYDDEDKILERVEEYIVIGNQQTHGKKHIIDKPHEKFAFPWLYSRSMHYQDNCIYVWKGARHEG